MNDEANGFVYQGDPLYTPKSSNVALAQYHRADQKLMVEYKNGSAYLYDPVSETEALAFWEAMSKGGHLWDHFRVRGSKTAHRKNYVRIR